MESGQSPIDQAREGCKIIHGPNESNFEEIYEYLRTLGVTKQVNNSNELSVSLIEEFEENKGEKSNIKEEIDNYGQNILNNVIEELKKYI
jgi:3-deoxy-D-manno-octulosonic-acid transferase